ncbi:MAG: potassium channel family protein [Alphaproteobacteria bacterium]|nr:potassium channel family protein [Alphaproteobacteria bacterium]
MGAKGSSASADLQASMHAMLAPEAWPGRGLSPVNNALCALIILASSFAILESEPTITQLAPRFFSVAETTFGILFGAEYLARLYAAGADPRYRGLAGRLRYMITPMALIDLVAILPIYVANVSADPLLLRICRLLRILRLAKLGRYSTAVQHIGEAVSTRRHELGLSVVLTAGVLLVAATLIYFFEAEAQPQQFGSIPRSLWWAIVTLTTVGYGDVYPITVGGRILAGLTAIAGVALIAIPTGILAAAFSDVFQRQRAAEAVVESRPTDPDPG